MRSREIASLQNKLAAAEASVGVAVERTRRDLDAEAERQRARLQADITALTLQNKYFHIFVHLMFYYIIIISLI